MEQIRQHNTVKTLLVAVLVVAIAVAMFFALMPKATMTAQAEGATDLIDALPDVDKITIDDKSAVQAAREAYDALTREQKACVPQEIRDKLLAAEKALPLLKIIVFRAVRSRVSL